MPTMTQATPVMAWAMLLLPLAPLIGGILIVLCSELQESTIDFVVGRFVSRVQFIFDFVAGPHSAPTLFLDVKNFLRSQDVARNIQFTKLILFFDIAFFLLHSIVTWVTVTKYAHSQIDFNKDPVKVVEALEQADAPRSIRVVLPYSIGFFLLALLDLIFFGMLCDITVLRSDNQIRGIFAIAWRFGLFFGLLSLCSLLLQFYFLLIRKAENATVSRKKCVS